MDAVLVGGPTCYHRRKSSLSLSEVTASSSKSLLSDGLFVGTVFCRRNLRYRHNVCRRRSVRSKKENIWSGLSWIRCLDLWKLMGVL